MTTVLRGALVVDGTGAPAVKADVAVVGDTVTTVGGLGRLSDGERVVDLDGLVLAPGFIDPHTHYDAQVMWDPSVSPSSLHGVTTVVAGNCGFSIAPLRDVDADYVQRMLARVEGMPLPALQEGVPWNWSTFPEYLEAVDSARPALNFGVMVGHSALRRRVLGPDSGAPDLDETARSEMRAHLREGLLAGAMGFSSSWGDVHFDGDGNPVRRARPASRS